MWMMPRWLTVASWHVAGSALRCARLPRVAAVVLVPLVDVVRRQIPGRDEELHVRRAQVRSRAAQHPGRRIFLVLVDALIEVDLVQVAEEREAMQRYPPLTASLLEIVLEVHDSLRTVTGSTQSCRPSIGSGDDSQQQRQLRQPRDHSVCFGCGF